MRGAGTTNVALRGLVEDAVWPPQAGTVVARNRLWAEVRTGADAYRELRADWRRLIDAQRGATIFQTPDLLDIWSQHFAGRESSLATAVVRAGDGRPVLIWPLIVERKALVRIARGAG